jgi:hypothetical protein
MMNGQEQFKSGMSSQIDEVYRSDSVKQFNESFTRASRDNRGLAGSSDNNLFPDGLIISERDFNLYE